MSNLGQFVSPRMGRVEQIHFVGIGGAGMCGIAEVLHNQGYRITGSDIGESSTVQRLKIFRDSGLYWSSTSRILKVLMWWCVLQRLIWTILKLWRHVN